MKYLGSVKKNIFWVFLLGLVCFLGRAGEPSVAQAMMPTMTTMGTHGLESGKAMPSSCPMKGNLPCCHGKDRVALCKASLCDLCVLSSAGEENTSPLSRIQPPALQVLADSGATHPGLLLKTQILHPPFPYQFSFFPPVSRPLLI